MNIIEIGKKENVGKKYEAYNNGKSNGIWTLKEEVEDVFELYNEYEDGITNLYYVSEIASLEFKEVIDWSKVVIDTKLLVSKDGEIWFRRYFAKYEDDKIYFFSCGASSYSVDDISNVLSWEYVKLYQK